MMVVNLKLLRSCIEFEVYSLLSQFAQLLGLAIRLSQQYPDAKQGFGYVHEP